MKAIFEADAPSCAYRSRQTQHQRHRNLYLQWLCAYRDRERL